VLGETAVPFEWRLTRATAVRKYCSQYRETNLDFVLRLLEHEPGTTAPSVADLYEKVVSSGSMSKSYSLAGLRTGWVAGRGPLPDVRDYTTISAAC
jgi:aspartate/methionine/tyrosine aminotransferase